MNLSSLEIATSAINGLLTEGVRTFVVAPGARSAPFAYVLAEAQQAGLAEVFIRIDERDAGFFALGVAKTGVPAAVITTSGSAVGNLFPAVMEAAHSALPLVVISADRPERLQGTGANQTTRQFGLFGGYVRAAFVVQDRGESAQEVFDIAARAARVSQGHERYVDSRVDSHTRFAGVSGPVQLDVCLDAPLVPDEGWHAEFVPAPVPQPPAENAPPSSASTALPVQALPVQGTQDQLGTVGQQAARAALVTSPIALVTSRTVVIAGDGAGAEAERFAREQGLPLLAEPSSNARFGPNAIEPYRLLIPRFGEQIERVVIFGRPTLSRPVSALINSTLPSRMYVPEPVAWFESGSEPAPITASLAELAEFAGRGEQQWLDQWRGAGERAQRIIGQVLKERREEGNALSGLTVAQHVWRNAHENLFIGSSNVVRDLDLMASTQTGPRRAFASRGLAGIDGALSTSQGIASAKGMTTTAYLGDITMLHDVGGLFIGDGERQPPLRIVVLNDSGGAIFSLLEHGQVAQRPGQAGVVERFFATPHQVNIAQLAAAYGLAHRQVRTEEELVQALSEEVQGMSILEVVAPRTDLRELHARIAHEVDPR